MIRFGKEKHQEQWEGNLEKDKEARPEEPSGDCGKLLGKKNEDLTVTMKIKMVWGMFPRKEMRLVPNKPGSEWKRVLQDDFESWLYN